MLSLGSREDFAHIPFLDDELLLQIMTKCKTHSLPKVIGTCKRINNIFNNRPRYFPVHSENELIVYFTDFVDESDHVQFKDGEAFLFVDGDCEINFKNYDDFCVEHLKDTFFRKISIYATLDSDNLAENFSTFMDYLDRLNITTIELLWRTTVGSISDGIKMFRPKVVDADAVYEINRLIQTCPQLCRVVIHNYSSIKRLAFLFPFITTHLDHLDYLPFWPTVNLVEQLQKCRNEHFQLAVLDGFLDLENRDKLQTHFDEVSEATLRVSFTQNRTFYTAAVKMKNCEKLLFIMIFYSPQKSIVKLFPAHLSSEVLSRRHPGLCTEHFHCQRFKQRVDRFAKAIFPQ